MLTHIHSTLRWASLPGTSLLAHNFGLRHAVDADYIAAMDIVTRKLMRVGAYGGTFVGAIRKLCDNLTIITVYARANRFAELEVTT